MARDRTPADDDDRERPAPLQDKDEPRTRPDRPTPSDDATLAERGGGTHAEFADAPASMAGEFEPDEEETDDEAEEADGD